MSMIALVEQASTPATPTAGKVRFFANSGGTLSSVDDAGVVTTYGSGITQEQVEDYVGALLQDSSTINVTYNDAGNAVTFDVLAGGVDHNSLANLTTGNPHTQYLLSSAAATTYQPLDSDLTAMAGLAGTGVVVRTGTGTATVRTITAGTGISVTNGDGVSGNPTVASTITQYTDELAQDAIGAALTDSSTIDFTYNDAGGTITAAVIPGGVNHNSLLNGGGNTHIDHSTVSINAGTYLSGGGDITATRTINHGNSAVTPATYGGVNAIPVLGIGATGHVDSASTVNPTAALLTGLVAGTDTPILATDTILAALAKLQAEVEAAALDPWIELNTASTYTNTSSTTGVGITELDLTITSGRKYYYEATLLYQAAATTTGLAVTVTSPDGASAPGAVMVNMPVAADGTAALYSGTVNTLGDYVTSTGVQTANTPFVCHIKGNFPASASGTLRITFRSEVNGSQVTISPGSTLLVREFV
jgi:hypothetical protein